MVHASIPDIAPGALRADDLWVEEDCVCTTGDCMTGLSFVLPVNPLGASIANREACVVNLLATDVL